MGIALFICLVTLLPGYADPPLPSDDELVKQLTSGQGAEVLDLVLKSPESHNALVLYFSAGTAVEKKRYEDAGFLYWAGVIKERYDLVCFPPTETGSEHPSVLLSAIRFGLEPAIYEETSTHPKEFHRSVQRLKLWSPKAPASYSPGYKHAPRKTDDEALQVTRYYRTELVARLNEESVLMNDAEYLAAFKAVHDFEEANVLKKSEDGRYPADAHYEQAVRTKARILNTLRENKVIRSVDEVPQEETSLTAAIKTRDRGLYFRLLVAGADPNEGDHFGFNALHNAAEKADLYWLEQSLSFGGDPNSVALLGDRTPLIEAIAGDGSWIDPEGPEVTDYQQIQKVKRLIAAGADVNCGTYSGDGNSCCLAAMRGHYDIVLILLDAGADPDQGLANWVYQRDDSGINEDQLAQFRQVRQRLISSGKMKDVLPVPDFADDPYSWDLKGEKSLFSAIKVRNKEAYSRLLKSGEDPNAFQEGDFDDTCALYLAAGKADVFWIREALAHGGNPNHQGDPGEGRGYDHYPPIFMAALRWRLANVKEFLKAGAKVDPQQPDGKQTPMGVAFEMGNFEMVVTFLEAGADPKLAHRSGKTMVEWFQQRDERYVGRESQLPWYRKAREILIKQGHLQK